MREQMSRVIDFVREEITGKREERLELTLADTLDFLSGLSELAEDGWLVLWYCTMPHQHVSINKKGIVRYQDVSLDNRGKATKRFIATTSLEELKKVKDRYDIPVKIRLVVDKAIEERDVRILNPVSHQGIQIFVRKDDKPAELRDPDKWC